MDTIIKRTARKKSSSEGSGFSRRIVPVGFVVVGYLGRYLYAFALENVESDANICQMSPSPQQHPGSRRPFTFYSSLGSAWQQSSSLIL